MYILKTKFFKICVSLFLLVALLTSYASFYNALAENNVSEELVITPLTDGIISTQVMEDRDTDSIIKVDSYGKNNKLSLIDKAIFDESDVSVKQQIKIQGIRDLHNKKAVVFLGNEQNLNVEQLGEILGVEESLKIEAEEQTFQDLKSVSFYYGEDNRLYVVFYLNPAETSKILPHIISQTNINIANIKSDVEDESSTALQLKKTEPNSGNPAAFSYNQTLVFNNTVNLMEVYHTVKPTRIGVGDDLTVWEIEQRLTASPYNRNYGTQTSKVVLYIDDLKDDDEMLEKYIPDTGINNSSSSASVSFGYSKNGLMAQASISQGTTYPDLQILANMRRAEGTMNWNFLYTKNSNIAKNSSTVTPKTIMTNKAGTLWFYHGGEVHFTATTGSWGSRESYQYRIDRRGRSIPDISIK